ncbi:hypothetical protein [Streptomyces griseoaurantiacus]|uniref:hypothetical protein n=1 Tax=Streptomyces griseoaurantiacus TaxID=68213 RepID=UPI00345F5936
MRRQDENVREKETNGKSARRPGHGVPRSGTATVADAAATLSNPTAASLLTLQRSAGNAAVATAMRNSRQNAANAAHASGARSMVQRSPGSSRERSTLTLRGSYVRQGNKKGKKTTSRDKVLYTSDLGPCVAVCGFDGNTAFMIHSDSTGTSGIGRTSLKDGINSLVAMGTGSGWTISLIGGSVPGCMSYLQQRYPDASYVPLGESEGAYITGDGVVAKSKRRLAGRYGVDSITIDE